jgi:hypothetical protein
MFGFGGGGGSEYITYLLRTRPPPSPSGIYYVRLRYIITIYAPIIYMAPCVMLLMRAASFTGASGRGLGPRNREFFGPCEMASKR